MRSVFIAALLTMSFWGHAKSDIPFALLEQQGQFEQKKFLKVLRKPFVSKGTYRFSPQSGIEWHTLSPVENQLLINREGVFEIKGETSQALTRNTTVSELLLALFSGDEKALETQFEIHWLDGSLMLVAVDDSVRQVVEKIQVRYQDTHITDIVMTEPGGNRTEIALHQATND